MSEEGDKLVDRDRVILQEDYQIAFWTNHFQVSEEVIFEIVKRVGPKISDVVAEIEICRDEL